ncbi:glycosyltransferase WbuB [Rhodococcus sp. 06-470-2]|uniref:glycosyltransferase family 4 protein n=1 Tax=unclassified Rhodococcus (in: high G+C Gram-positive bacteria) TaxID=192944 RepID=UPI000B9A3589|nr:MULTISPECIES: glycosyltransferase family 4 protein [unclassified Rhodococcus (in: high G+C Gram-positive bacteria)]OZC67715.1 glycosyltransferase WbuB [Rhodococcus sp. 06-470-2]OZE62232.1 glycosyltransferase WbuB [Rhodococcus sp. 05-2221-1B]OZE62977.1 glycosyltransferase WbuB [Rhodococcus sp. 05-2221-1B]
MRITLIGLNYKPEVTGIAPYTADVAEGLSQRGYDVHVVTGFPHYPQWAPDPRYAGPTIEEMVDGVHVTRHRHYVPGSMTVTQRAHLELSFGTRVARSRIPSSNVVVCVSPALVSTGLVMARLKAQPFRPALGVWVQDLYSRGVIETGTMQGSSAGATTNLESGILRAADGVAVIHRRFAEHAHTALRVPESKLTVIPNWTHMPHQASMSRDHARDLLGWSRDAVIALHAGNMGLKQGLENVVEAARESDRRGGPVQFVLMGDGNQRQILEELGTDISSLRFVRSLPEKEFRAALDAADVLLVNERPEVSEMAVPSKLTAYFGSGSPVLAATAAGSVTDQEVRSAGAGVRVDPANPAALLEGVIELATDPDRSAQLVESGNRYLRHHMSRDVALDRFEEWVHTLASAHPTKARTASSAGLGV